MKDETLIAHAVENGVVNDAPLLVTDQGVAGAAQGHVDHVRSHQPVKEPGRVRAGNLQTPHVGHVEDAGLGAHVPCL